MSEKRIIENFAATKISLEESEVTQLQDRDKNFRVFHDVSLWLPRGMTTEEAFDVEEDDKFAM